MAKSKAKKQQRSTQGDSAIGHGSIVEDAYGNYRIKAGRLSGNFVARAFATGTAGSQGVIAEVSGASEEDAIAQLKERLATWSAERTAARRWEWRSNISVPGMDEYIEALRQAGLSETQLAMLKAHALAGEDGLTSRALTRASGYKSDETAIKAFTRAGAHIASFLHVKTSPDVDPAFNDPGLILGYREKSDAEGPEVWVMHEELRLAVQAAL